MRAALFSSLLLLGAALQAQSPAPRCDCCAPAPAKDLVSSAVKWADAKGKKALVSFTASWCQWCKRLKAAMDDPGAKAAVERHFAPLWLTVYERGDTKALENDGADAILAEWAGGGRPGIPFMAILGPDEKPVSTSMRALKPGGAPANIGFPGDDAERDAFMAFLKTGAPDITADEEAAIRKALTAAMGAAAAPSEK